MRRTTEDNQLHHLFRQMNSAAERFLTPSTPQETYKAIIDEAKQLMHSEYGSVFLMQDDTLKRIYSSYQDLYSIRPRKRGRTYQALHENNVSYYHVKDIHEPHPMLKRLGIKTVIYIPLTHSDKSVGVMNMLLQKKWDFSQNELDLFQMYGRLASLAIHKTHIYAESQSQLENQRLFFSIVSHEIKSPLSAMHILIQLLERKALHGEPAELSHMQRLVYESGRLNKIVTEFLEKNEYQFTTRTYQWKRTSLYEIVIRAVQEVAFSYPSHDFTLNTAIERGFDIVQVDIDMMMRAIVNLLTNACKYSSPGTTIDVTLTKDKEYISLSIKDQGKGIPKKDIAHVFKKFYRADTSKKGMGLGLYLVKTIIDSHKGKIHINSEVGKGTVVSISLPIYVNNRGATAT